MRPRRADHGPLIVVFLAGLFCLAIAVSMGDYQFHRLDERVCVLPRITAPARMTGP